MLAIKVKIGHSFNYVLNPTNRKGFYEIKTGNWFAVVSKNTQKVNNFGDEDTQKIETQVSEIRQKAFA